MPYPGSAPKLMPTLEEIAQLAQVSRSTVSRVINDDPNVSEKTRSRVRAVIQQINFQPNMAARRLAGGRTRIIGLVIPMGVSRLFSDPFFPILIQGIASACNADEHTVMLWLADPEFERRQISQILSNGLIEGIVVASNLLDDQVIQTLSSSHLPFVIVGRSPGHPEISYVDVDNQNGAYDAVSRLFRIGRSRIGTIAGPENMIAGSDRMQGYLAGLHDHGHIPNPSLIAISDFTEMGGYEAAQKLLKAHPDAIFVASDTMAMGTLRALREARMRVPEDVAVIGFDDIPLAAHTIPPLTTIRQPIFQIGSLAVETLIQQIEKPAQQPRRIVLPTELVIRASG